MDSQMPIARPEQDRRFPYLPGLDGLRALAVIAVLLYHADLTIAGGFLGVESFFVLSGFLITALLLSEWRQTGRVDLGAFWLRRARRLLPALFLMLVGTLALASIALPDEIAKLHADLFAALAYVMNWYLVFSQQSYFDPMVRPSLLQHLWSLAIEEQFYLLWPILFGVGMRYLRPSGVLRATLAVSAASMGLMALLYQPGADPSRIYYGTDTRAGGLLLGAALALAWTPTQSSRSSSRLAGGWLDLAGVAALGALLAGYIWLYDYHPLLYRGGFALVALATATTIVAATHPRARWLPQVLRWRPLRWIGLRSYGIYLWHWPIFMLTRPYQDVPIDGLPLLALRLTIVVGLAELSYRLVELPVRHGALERAWRALWSTYRPTSAARLGTRYRGLRLRWLRLPLASVLVLSTAACVSSVDMRTVAEATATSPTAALLAATSAGNQAVAPTELAPPTEPPSTATAIIEASPTDAPPTATIAATSTAEPAPTEVTLAPFDPALAAKLQQVLDRTVADGTIPGAVLSVRIPGAEPWVGASGVRDRRTKEPMEPTTNVRIASISKIFTAVVVLQLVEEGKIQLDQPIATWLQDLVPNGDRITVHNLLQHTSGLYDYLEDRNFVNRTYREPDRIFAPRELVEYAAQFPPLFRAGAKGAWDYSSTNFVLLGMIVEQATGNSLAHEMRQRIFEPLGLEQTFFTPDEAIEGTLARGYSGAVDQTRVAMSFAYATANIVSTAGDVRQFIQALLDGQLLKPETLDMMLTFVNGKGQYRMPALAYGLGIMQNQLPVGPGPDGQTRPAGVRTVVGHIGGFGGFRSAVWSSPENGITIALGVNQAATDPNILATKAFDAILTHQGL
jgi:peptidoglycan/LPS O-acetylase OafA/YrhL/CubicO group peptidase (beta-lactamase class C family)